MHRIVLGALIAALLALTLSPPASARRSDTETFWEDDAWEIISLRVGRRGASAELPEGSFMLCLARRTDGFWGDDRSIKFSDEASGWGLVFNFPFGRHSDGIQSTETIATMDFGNGLEIARPASFSILQGRGILLVTLTHDTEQRAAIAASENVTIDVGVQPRRSNQPTSFTFPLPELTEMLGQLGACRDAGIQQDIDSPPAPYEPPAPRGPSYPDDDY